MAHLELVTDAHNGRCLTRLNNVCPPSQYNIIQLYIIHRVEKNHDFFFKLKKSDFFYLNRIYLIFLIFLNLVHRYLYICLNL